MDPMLADGRRRPGGSRILMASHRATSMRLNEETDSASCGAGRALRAGRPPGDGAGGALRDTGGATRGWSGARGAGARVHAGSRRVRARLEALSIAAVPGGRSDPRGGDPDGAR